MTASLTRKHVAERARLAVRMLVDNPRLSVPAAAADVGVSVSSVYHRWRDEHPGTSPGRRRPSKASAIAAVAVRLLEDLPALRVYQAASAVGIDESTLRRHWMAKNRGRSLIERAVPYRQVPSAAATVARVAPFADFCDVMHECLAREMSASELFSAVRNSYGSPAVRSTTEEAEERRLYRALKRLLDQGRIERIGKRYSDNARYRRVR